MTKEDYAKRMKRVKQKNLQKEYRKRLREERDKYSHKLGVETSKLLAIYLFILLNAIVVYAMVAMWKFSDLTYLGVLITDIAAQVLVYAVYCLKAYKAKKSEENMKFKREQLQGSTEGILEAGAESTEPIQMNNTIVNY